MSVTTDGAAAVLPAGVTSRRRLGQVLIAITVGLRPMLVGYWGVMLVLFLLGGIVSAVVSGPAENSIWDYGTQSPKFFSASLGITMTPMLFTLLIAQGVTRRMYSVAAGIYLTGAAVATSLLWVVAYQAEHLIYAAQGWSQTLTNPHLFSRPTQSGMVFAEYFLLIMSHQVAGWVIGIGFYRLGAWKGILLLPIGLLPAAAAELLLVPQVFISALERTGYQRPSLAVGIPVVLAVTALGSWYGYRLIRPMGLKPAKG